MLLIVIGAGAMAALGILVLRLGQRVVVPERPEGWMIIRPPNEVCALALSGDDVWAGGKDGLFRIERDSGALRTLPDGKPTISYVTGLLQDARGCLWIAHLEGLTCLDGVQWNTWPVGTQGLRARPLSLLENPDGALWVGTEDGLTRFREKSFTPVDVPADVGLTTVDVLCRDRSGALWLGCASPTRGGLFRYDGETWRVFTNADGLLHHSVTAITQLQDGTLWVATGFANQGAASRWTGERFESWTKKDGLAGEKVRSIFEDQSRRIWFGSEYDGIAVLDAGRWTVLKPQAGLAGREAKVIVQDADGIYWIGTDEGLSRITGWPPRGKTEAAP